MYKEIVKLVIMMISQPTKTWKMLQERREKDERETGSIRYEAFQSDYLYPFIGILTVAAFFSVCTRQEFDIEQALKSAIVTFVSTFGGFYLASYLLNELWQGFFKKEKNLPLCQMFVGFSSVLMFTLDIVWMLLPDFFFLYIFIVYTFYIVWEGSTVFMQIEETAQMKFTVFASVLIIAMPHLIEKVLILLMPGLR